MTARNDRVGWQANLPPRWLNDITYRSLSPEAWTLFTWTLVWGVDQENDGIILRRELPFVAAPTLSRDQSHSAALELVQAGLWEETEDGFIVTDWERSQVTTADMESRRAEWRAKKQAQRARSASESLPPETPLETVPLSPGDIADVSRESPGEKGHVNKGNKGNEGNEEINSAIYESEDEVVTPNWKSKMIPNTVCVVCRESFASPDPERFTVCPVQDDAHASRRAA
jgi:hypothetical protein